MSKIAHKATVTRILPILLTLGLSACGGSGGSSSSSDRSVSTVDDIASCSSGCEAQEKSPAYALAQGCYTLQSRDGNYLVTTDDAYAFTGSSEEQAEAFFLKPTRLGSFLLYDRQGGFFAEDFLNTKRHSKASISSEWKINLLDITNGSSIISTEHTLISSKLGLRLQVISGKPVLRDTRRFTHPNLDRTPITFTQQPQNTCAQFPEASLNATVADAFYQEKDPNDPIVGYADVHTHIGFPKAMGGSAMSGEIFHPYGIEHALHDCAELHGKNGGIDFLEAQNVSGGAGGHNTTGYPDFTYWPNRSTNTHVQGYYRWIQRAHLGGLRIMVTLVTGNPTFCQLLGVMRLGYTDGGCSGVDAVELQTDYLYEMQDYIDAQEGGPGKGWFRIVTSPEAARAAIAKNQLAVILGIEHGTLFNCDGNFGGCTEDYIDQKLDEVYDMGIRSIFPIHRFDNAFGGTRPAGGSSGSWMHLTGMLSNSKVNNILDLIDPTKLLFKGIGGFFWDMQECPDGAHGATGIQSMQDFVDEDFSLFTDAAKGLPTVGPIVNAGLNAIFIDKLKPLPDYAHIEEGSPSCNQRGLQPIGKHLINRMIDKRMILEIDHLSYATLTETLAVLEERQYSGFVSSHGWLNGNTDIRERALSLGGILAPMNSNPSNVAQRIASYKEEIQDYNLSEGVAVGLAMGSDLQGVTSQTSGDSGVIINYPFTSVDGLVTFSQPKTGNRTFDFAEEGIAHYGLYPEWVENFKQVDAASDDDVMDNFMNSAESYVQMWERATATEN